VSKSITQELIDLIPRKRIAYRWYRASDGKVFHNVSLQHNGHEITSFECDESEHDAAMEGLRYVLIEERARRCESAKKAAITRRNRTNDRVYDVARALIDGRINPAVRCNICRKIVTDDESRLRGIGSDCWQAVLRAIERLRGES
jgi:hypothetical protein